MRIHIFVTVAYWCAFLPHTAPLPLRRCARFLFWSSRPVTILATVAESVKGFPAYRNALFLRVAEALSDMLISPELTLVATASLCSHSHLITPAVHAGPSGGLFSGGCCYCGSVARAGSNCQIRPGTDHPVHGEFI